MGIPSDSTRAKTALAILSPNEVRLSAIFRWLLDEHETHGQGSIFRDLFVSEFLGDTPEAWAGAKVRCEVPTTDGRGRIDLLIVSRDGQRCVAIENKPWAGWQSNQLPRYLSDQLAQRPNVRVHALIGRRNVEAELTAHWSLSSSEPVPTQVEASDFERVNLWLESCASVARADKVRSFIFDLVDFSRKFILKEPNLNEVSDTADLILAGGEDAIGAARAIIAALPLALSRDVARRLGGVVETIGNHPTLALEVDGVRLNFALFGDVTPWVGVIEQGRISQLKGAIAWSPPERLWPRWTYLSKVGGEGRELADAAALADPEVVSRLIPIVARRVIGDQPPV